MDLGDFFNYSLTPAKWRTYTRDIQQAQAESRLQERIQLYELGGCVTIDASMPLELAAALAGKVRNFHLVGSFVSCCSLSMLRSSNHGDAY